MKHRYFNPFFLLIINIILLACSQPPPPTPTTEGAATATKLPTATAVSPITPTATPLPSSILFKQPEMQRISEAISLLIINPAPDPLAMWSPDGQWLSFWGSGKGNEEWKSADAGSEAKRLNFVNVMTGAWCEMSSIALSERFPTGIWLDNSTYFVTSEIAQRTVRLTPCSESSMSVEPYTPFEAIAPQIVADEKQSLSPNKEFSVITTFDEPPSNSKFLGAVATTTFTRVGESNSFEVSYQPNIADGLGGQWVSERLFLINTSVERGPLLVDVLEERVMPLLDYGLKMVQPNETGYGMFTARPLTQFGSDYLILTTVDHAWLFSIKKLTVFPLPFNGVARFLPLSDSVTYLVLQDHRDVIPDRWDLYIHPFERGKDPQTWEWVLLDEMVNSWQWSQSGNAVVLAADDTIRWRQFPSGELTGEAAIDGYTMEVLAWSPNNRAVLLRGINKQNEQLVAILTATSN